MLFAAVSLFLSSCELHESIVPSSNITTREKSASDYDAIDISHAFTVYVNFSDTEESIEIEANENLHPYISVRKVSRTLIIELENNINIRGNATLNVYITTKNVTDYTASGASSFIVEDKLSDHDVKIDLSGASFFSGDLETDYTDASLSGASHLELEGNTGSFTLDASGASSIRDYNFIVDNLDIDLSGASDAHLTVNNEISADVSGASSLYYRGTGVVSHQNVSGASEIIKVGE